MYTTKLYLVSLLILVLIIISEGFLFNVNIDSDFFIFVIGFFLSIVFPLFGILNLLIFTLNISKKHRFYPFVLPTLLIAVISFVVVRFNNISFSIVLIASFMQIAISGILFLIHIKSVNKDVIS